MRSDVASRAFFVAIAQIILLWNNGMRRVFEPEITEQINIHGGSVSGTGSLCFYEVKLRSGDCYFGCSRVKRKTVCEDKQDWW